MISHPNRGRRSPDSNPSQADIQALRHALQVAKGIGITEAQLACARAIHASLRAWQQWEQGGRRMHPAFWSLAQIKVREILNQPD